MSQNSDHTRREPRLFKLLRKSPRLKWILLGLGSMGLRLALAPFPEVVETVYSRGIFLGIRYLHHFVFSWWPVSIFSLLLVAVVILLVRRWRKRRKARRESGVQWTWRQHLAEGVYNLLTIACILLFIFNVIWGFNYERVALEDHLELEVKGLEVEQLCEEMEWAARRMEASRALIPEITDDSLSFALMPEGVEEMVNADLRQALGEMDYPAPTSVRIRVFPGGTFLRLGIAGIYNPITGEGNIAGAMTPQRYPFTMAHEMGHAYGFGDEGTCNLLGLIACTRSTDPFIRYSGLLAYWSYTGNELAKLDPLLYAMLRRQLDTGVTADLRANYNNFLKYNGAIARAGMRVNDAYLRSMGVKEGISSYNRVVNLFAEWRQGRM